MPQALPASPRPELAAKASNRLPLPEGLDANAMIELYRQMVQTWKVTPPVQYELQCSHENSDLDTEK